MIKIYGMPTCPYCDYIHEQIIGRENEFEYGTPDACSIEDHKSGRKGC